MSANVIQNTSADALLKRAHSLKSEAETKALYADWASTYDATMIDGLGYKSPEKAAVLLALNIADKTARILDVGTGTGLVGKELADRGFQNIDGLDYSPAMLEVARATNHYQDLFEADLNDKLQLSSEAYDALICIGTFTHGHIDSKCLTELFRLLKPGGKFVTAIRKDYWHSAGFAKKIDAMAKKNIVNTLFQQEDKNYAESEEPESWFLVWEKTNRVSGTV